MKKLFNDQQLETMAVPSVHMKQHQLQLKRALLSSVQTKPVRPHTLKTRWRTLMTKKPLITAGLTLGVAVLALTAGAFIAPKSSVASAAQDAVKQSSNAVKKLTPEERGALEQRIEMNPQDQLQEAQKAKDLQLLTYDQVAGQLPPGDGPHAGSGNAPNLRTLKYLKYTNAQGATAIVGIDSHNLPVVSMQMMRDPGSSDRPSGQPKSFHVEGSSSSGPVNQTFGQQN